jgi:hypothetical protein
VLHARAKIARAKKLHCLSVKIRWSTRRFAVHILYRNPGFVRLAPLVGIIGAETHNNIDL